jgi:hypothetical protein
MTYLELMEKIVLSNMETEVKAELNEILERAAWEQSQAEKGEKF